MRTGVPGEQIPEGILDGLGECFGHTHRERGTEGVPQPARVLDRRPVVGARDADPDGAAGGGEVGRPSGLRPARGQFGIGQRAEQPQSVGDTFGVLDAPVLRQPLEFALQLVQHVGVQQLAQLGLAQQLGEEAGVEREGRGTAFGERRVALVEELGDVAEEQRPGER